jgi:polyphosphate kinase 2 (PPK2 family)
MGFCTRREYERFLEDVLPFEHMLIGAGIQILKYYLDISKGEQAKRLRDRRHDPLKQWKISPIDKVAVKHFSAYSEARNRMLEQTSSALSPWIIVRADDKRAARLNVIRDLLTRVNCPGINKHFAVPDRDVVFPYEGVHAQTGRLSA